MAQKTRKRTKRQATRPAKKRAKRAPEKPSFPARVFRTLRGMHQANKKRARKIAVAAKRRGMRAEYDPLVLVSAQSGTLDSWEQSLLARESTVGIILGARGSGKTAIGMRVLENLYAEHKTRCAAMGFAEADIPSWIEHVTDLDQIRNGSFLLIDEGGILFSSRKSMSKPNEILSELILIARHRNISILFISQNSSNLDVNILRQADYLILKPASLLQLDFERKTIRDIYRKAEKGFSQHASLPGIAYVYATEFRGFVTNPLPSFWSNRVSKSFRSKTA